MQLKKSGRAIVILAITLLLSFASCEHDKKDRKDKKDKTLTPEQVLARGNLYDVVRNYHGSLAPAAPAAAVTAAPTTNAAQASFNKISGLLSPQR